MRSAILCLVSLLGFWTIPASAQNVITITEEFGAAGGVSFGPDGLIYVADFGEALNGEGGANGTTVYRMSPDGEPSVFATGLQGASGNAFDDEGNLYQSNIGGWYVSKVTPDGGVSTYASAGIVAPVGVAVDAEGNVYNTNCQSPGRISKTTPDGSTTTLAQSTLMNCPNGLTIDDEDNLYTANFSDGRVVKITPDGTVSLLATLPSPGPGVGNGHLTFANGRLYVCNWSGWIYEVTLAGDARAIAGTGQLGTQDGPADEATFFRPNGISASVTGDTLYLNQSTEVVGFSDPQLHPNVVRMITGVHQTFVDTEDEADADGFGLAPGAPNPFRSATRITYTLPHAMPVSLRVYDVLGRAVHTLVGQVEGAGTHDVQWDGRSEAGQLLAAGVYFLVLEGADRRAVQQVTLLR